MKKLFFILLFLPVLIFYILYPSQAFLALQEGLILWLFQIVPTLLPFTIIAYICVHSNLFHKFLGLFILLFGFLFGMPLGVKLSCDFYSQNCISKKDAQLYCCFCNNLSPVFLISYVFTEQLQKRYPIGPSIALFYGIPLLLFILFRWVNKQRTSIIISQIKDSDFSIKLIDEGIIKGFETMLRLCGYILYFSILSKIILMIDLLPEFGKHYLTAILEITNGIHLLAEDSCSLAQYILVMISLSFSGISCIVQSASIIRQTDLSLGKYITAKMLLAILTGLGAAFLGIQWLY